MLPRLVYLLFKTLFSPTQLQLLKSLGYEFWEDALYKTFPICTLHDKYGFPNLFVNFMRAALIC
jgi:hypothetical protein